MLDTKMQRYKDTGIQGYRDTRIQGYKDRSPECCSGFLILDSGCWILDNGYKDTGIQELVIDITHEEDNAGNVMLVSASMISAKFKTKWILK